MYQVIARKYRPQSFAELIGQEHVRTTIENAISQKRIAHGYIFAGQRGTGKTTVARILARCLNCVEGPTPTPCGQCSSCLEVTQGNAPDVIEIDAASNRGINEMRELRENVRYRPARDRYKVFIIDEAHQITNEAFNALLKTLEEPPEWAVFIMCTTEAHKIPTTIASRSQQFSFRSVDFGELIERMKFICAEEGITADETALSVLAQAGEGSVRDSLSALDQAIACCGTKLDGAEVRNLLGLFSLEALETVTTALGAGDSERLLEIVFELERNGKSLQHYARELSRYFRNLLVAKIAGQQTRLISASAQDQERLRAAAERFSEADLTRYLQIALELFGQLQYSLQPRLHLELGLLRLLHAGRLKHLEEVLKGIGGGPAPVPAATPSTPPPPVPAPRSGFKASAPVVTAAPAAAPAGAAILTPPASPAAKLTPATSGPLKERLLAELKERKAQFSVDAVEHSEVVQDGGTIEFIAPKEFGFTLKDKSIMEALTAVLGKAPKVKITVGAGASAAPAEPKASAPQTDEATLERVMTHPAIRQIQELFPGTRVSGVRDLKE